MERCPLCKNSEKENLENIRHWIDRYSILFAHVDSGLEMSEAQMNIFRRWFDDTCD